MKSGSELSRKVCEKFDTRSVFQIAEICDIKVIFGQWFPATFGEFDHHSKTICVNENAPIAQEQIIAHELGHYFLREFKIENIVDEERYCDEFARAITDSAF